MRTKLLTIIIFLLIPTVIYSQCPGATAISYKNKAKNLGPQEFSKQQAYIWLATYYAYKCECDTGSPRSQQLVGMINGIVDTYSAYTKNAYGSISKVSTCKTENGTGSSETTGETGDPNASNHGSGITIEPRKSFTQELAEDLGITQNEIQVILEGNYEGAVDNMNRNRLTNQLSDVFGGNSEIASTLSNGLYNLASSIGEERWENEVKVGKEILNQINLFNSNYISFKKPKTNINLSDESNFDNENWKLTQNEFFNSKKVDNNTIEVSFKNNPSLNSLRNNDIHFAELDLKNFDVTQNFDITFEIGYPTESKTLNNVVLNAPFIGLYISETNLFEAHPISANFKYNFTPLLNKYTSLGESGMSYISQEYKDFYFSHIKLGKSTFDLSDYKQVRKKEKSLIKIYKKINKDYNQDFYFVKYRIVKENDKAKIQLFYPNENMEMNELYYDSEYFDFKFKNTNKIYFGATYGVNLLNSSIVYPKVEKIRIRNFSIK